MGAIFEFIANIFGYALNFIYNIVNNYGLAVILFTILLKLIMMPYNIKQQKTMKKTQKVQEQVKVLQEKYSNDPVRQNQEVMDLYKREKISPMSGCLGTIVTLFIFISIFYLVSRPLTFMRHIDSEKLAEYTKKLDNTVVEQKVEENKEETKTEENIETNNSSEQEASSEETKQEEVIAEENKQEEVKQEEAKTEENKQEEKENNNNEENKQENQKRKNYIEIAIIREFGPEDEEVNLNMNFLGLNLSDIPMENLNNFTVYIIPVLYVITSIIMMKLTKMQTAAARKQVEKEEGIIVAKKDDVNNKDEDKKEEKKEDDQQVAMDQMTKTMTYMMPIMSVSISLIAPLGLALYWFVSNLFAICERLITNAIVKKSEGE